MLLLILAPCTPSASVLGLLTAVDDPATPSNSLAFSTSSLFKQQIISQSMTISHRHSKQQNRGERYNSGEDGTNDEESSSMNKKKKRRTKGKKKKHEPQQLEHLQPAHSQDLILDKLPPRRQVLSRARHLRLINLRIGIDELFLVPGYICSNGEQHFRDWDHKSIW